MNKKDFAEVRDNVTKYKSLQDFLKGEGVTFGDFSPNQMDYLFDSYEE